MKENVIIESSLKNIVAKKQPFLLISSLLQMRQNSSGNWKWEKGLPNEHFHKLSACSILFQQWLIDCCLTPLSNKFQSYHGDQITYSCVFWFSHTSTPHNILSKQLATFLHRPLNSPLGKDECQINCFQTWERMLAELGFELTAPGLTVANDWGTGTRPFSNKQTTF